LFLLLQRRQIRVAAIPDRAEQATELHTPLFARMSDVLTQYDVAQLATPGLR
jgi:hypothetical protein